MPMRTELSLPAYSARPTAATLRAALARAIHDTDLQIVIAFAIAGLVGSAALLEAFPILDDVASALARLS